MRQKDHKNNRPKKSQKSVNESQNPLLDEITVKIQEQQSIESGLESDLSILQTKIENTKQSINERFASNKEKSYKDLSQVLNKIYVLENNAKVKKLNEESNIKEVSRYLEMKKEELTALNFEIEKYAEYQISNEDFELLTKEYQEIKDEMETLETRIKESDPIEYEQSQKEELFKLIEKLERKRNYENCLIEEVGMKEMEEDLEKSKLVVELGNLNRLKLESAEKEQNVKGLKRHSEQIHERVEAMKREKKKLQKNPNKRNFAAYEELLKLEKEYEEFNEAIHKAQEKITRQEEHLKKCITHEEMFKFQKMEKQIQERIQESKTNLETLEKKKMVLKVEGEELSVEDAPVKPKKKEKKLKNICKQVETLEDEANKCELTIETLSKEILNLENSLTTNNESDEEILSRSDRQSNLDENEDNEGQNSNEIEELSEVEEGEERIDEGKQLFWLILPVFVFVLLVLFQIE